MEQIYSKINKEVIAVINRRSSIVKDRLNLCDASEYLQVAAKKLDNKTSFVPHRHKILKRETDRTQEAWVFLSGSVLVKLYDLDNSLIVETVLSAGDCVVVFKAGHAFEVLEDDTILYEFKTGPYYGVEKDKEIIDEG